MDAQHDPGSRAVESARRAAEQRLDDGGSSDHPVSPEDVERTERRAEAARLGAAQAARSAAQSMERSAELHERVASVEDDTIRQLPGAAAPQQQSADYHRRAAAQDRELAEQKRNEAAADATPGDPASGTSG